MWSLVRSILGSLTALLFLGASIAPAPFRHTHSVAAPLQLLAGGHSHDRTVHQHGHVHPHRHTHSQKPASRENNPVASHFHLTWLWFDISFPDRRPRNGDPTDTQFRLPPTVTASLVSINVSPSSGRDAKLPLLSTVAPRLHDSVQLRNLDDGGLAMPLRSLLSDTARRERTGVQLI